MVITLFYPVLPADFVNSVPLKKFEMVGFDKTFFGMFRVITMKRMYIEKKMMKARVNLLK